MRLDTITQLLNKFFEEYAAHSSLAEIPESIWYRKSGSKTVSMFGMECETPLGPAAGPHTQLAVNIIAAYLTGSRFMELKTVQILDSLEIDKPCIHVLDEGYNTEWSTELSLDEAWEEYAKAWIILHFFERIFKLKTSTLERSFVFNMSVGYDLKGIMSDRMNAYINRMHDSSAEPRFSKMVKDALDACIQWCAIIRCGTDEKELKEIAASISGRMCSSATLSTMHGCPKDEIEKIASYLMKKKGFDTYVKLNPTLLGYEKVRSILDGLGYGYVGLNEEGFEHDLELDDALRLLKNLKAEAHHLKRRFGVKLTNTLASPNTLKKLPGEEMYMSGRTLFPLSVHVALELSRKFKGELPISFSGGLSLANARQVFECGIRPVTIATEMLKPGGYGRMVQIAKDIEESDKWDMEKIDVAALEAVAADSLTNEQYKKEYRGTDVVQVKTKLPVFDCYVAPCIAVCPVGQDVPGYIALASAGEFERALECIYEDNPLPGITGHICNHECQEVCTRLEYEGTIRIRDMKKCITDKGRELYEASWKPPVLDRPEKVAIIGAGPAGLSAAYFLALEGFHCTVFEREPGAGGVVGNIIPGFRIPEHIIADDVEFIKKHGVEFVFGTGDSLSAEDIVERGFSHIIVAVGTYAAKPYKLENDGDRRIEAYDFLRTFNTAPETLSLGSSVAVVGAGDTAMDCARAALRSEGVKEVTVFYRRSVHEMPASPEEYELALGDGIRFRWLTNPIGIEKNGTLKAEKMELGPPGKDGRAAPRGTGIYEFYEAETIISAIGDMPDKDNMGKMGFSPDADSVSADGKTATVTFAGDARTGSTTIIAAMADGRKAAARVGAMHGVTIIEREKSRHTSTDRTAMLVKRTTLYPEVRSQYEVKEKTWHVVQSKCKQESDRCLQCSSVCNKCVDVCPNRSNIAVPVSSPSLFSQQGQIVHIHASCNECGNCGFYCPHNGLPYMDKPTVFSSKEDFASSKNPGWYVEGKRLYYRLKNTEGETDIPKLSMLTDSDNKDESRFFSLFEQLYSTRKNLFDRIETGARS